ncbi:uncharacterized protein ACH125_012802 [Urocitellus parryii]
MARREAPRNPGFLARLLGGTWCLLYVAGQVCGDQSQGAVFLREFTLIRRESLNEDFLSDLLNSHKTEDPATCLEGFTTDDHRQPQSDNQTVNTRTFQGYLSKPQQLVMGTWA